MNASVDFLREKIGQKPQAQESQEPKQSDKYDVLAYWGMLGVSINGAVGLISPAVTASLSEFAPSYETKETVTIPPPSTEDFQAASQRLNEIGLLSKPIGDFNPDPFGQHADIIQGNIDQKRKEDEEDEEKRKAVITQSGKR